MPRVVESTVYQFDELSDAAKERARDWLRECRDASDFDHVIEDAERVASILGIEFETRPVKLYGGGTRQAPCVWWNLSYSQGDGASFDGSYAYAKRCGRKIREYAPQDSKLHCIAGGLTRLQHKHGFALTAKCTNDRDTWTRVSVDTTAQHGNVEPDAEKELADLMRSFAAWIYSQLRTENEYQNSDEQIDDTIRANEYEFTENGSPA